jgi:arginyl-tRNA synthetase
MLLDLQSRLSERIRAAVRRTFDVDLEQVAFQYPPNVALGDLALTAPFDLAKSLKRKPREIGEQLAAALPNGEVRRAEVAGGGYVNLFLDRGAFALALHASLREGRMPAPVEGPVIVEHTSINPNKAAHVGHVRNAVLGDTFVRVLKSRGHQVGVQNYIDDTGVQVADVVVGFRHIEKKSLDDVKGIPGKFDYYCWDLYARVGDFYATGAENKALQGETLHAIERGGNADAELGAYVAARIVDCHLATMERLGIRYDLLARESDILRLHFWQRAFELLKASGAIRLESEGKNAGCWVLSMETDAKDEDKIIVRSNGTVTYTGKDIAYQLWKLGRLGLDFRYRRHEDWTPERPLWTSTHGAAEPGAPAFGSGASLVYNVIDVGQSYPQRVVKAGVAAVAGPEAADGTRHLGYEKVVLSKATAQELGYDVEDSDGIVKVSGRRGLGVKADDLIDALERKASKEIETRDPERSPADRERAAHAIAVGALRYFLLRFSRNKIITFDMEEALAFTGETGPYIQNSVVRARSILAKLAAEGHDVGALLARATSPSLLEPWLATPEGTSVWELFLAMARSEEIVEAACRSEEPSLMTRHAFQVAQAFHGYYQNPSHSVLRAENDDLRAARVLVVDLFVRHVSALAALLGIPIPDRM